MDSSLAALRNSGPPSGLPKLRDTGDGRSGLRLNTRCGEIKLKMLYASTSRSGFLLALFEIDTVIASMLTSAPQLFTTSKNSSLFFSEPVAGERFGLLVEMQHATAVTVSTSVL